MPRDEAKQFQATTSYAQAMQLSHKLWTRVQKVKGFNSPEYLRHKDEIMARKEQAVHDFQAAGGLPLDTIITFSSPDDDEKDHSPAVKHIQDRFGKSAFVDIGCYVLYVYCHSSIVGEVIAHVLYIDAAMKWEKSAIETPDIPGIVTWPQAETFLKDHEIEPEESDFSDIVFIV